MTTATLDRQQSKTANKIKSAPLRATVNTASVSVPTSKSAPQAGAAMDDPNSIFYMPPGAMTKSAHAPSPTLITLQLRALGEPFMDIHQVAEANGLRYPRNGWQALGLTSRDTGVLISTLRWNNWDHIQNQLELLEFQIDPENCEAELNVGYRFVCSLKRMAKALDAAICDEFGKQVPADALEALGGDINEVMTRRVGTARSAAAIDLPDGSQRFLGPVSFQNCTYAKQPGKARSRTPTYNHFDVPALSYNAARAKAFRMVEELKRTYAAHAVERPKFAPLLCAALEVSRPRTDFRDNHSCRETVAAQFLEVLQSVFALGLENISAKWLSSHAEHYEGFARQQEERRAEQKREFVERMRAAKAAKKARAQDAGARSSTAA